MPAMMARVVTVAFEGVEARRVDVEVQVSNSGALDPAFFIVGLADKAVTESRERVRAAFAGLGLALPKRIVVNLAPADVKKEGSHYDLPIALGLMCAMGVLPMDSFQEWSAIGELSLDGRIAPVAGALPAAVATNALGLGLICPEANGAEAAWAGDARVLAPRSLIAVVNHVRGSQVMAAPKPGPMVEGEQVPDLRDVRGRPPAPSLAHDGDQDRPRNDGAAGAHRSLTTAVRRSAAMIIETLRPSRAARLRRPNRWPAALAIIVALTVIGVLVIVHMR
jgi:magnesium chelatase family protein